MFKGGYWKGKASRETIQRSKDRAWDRAEAWYEKMMKSGLPFCPNCSKAWYISFEREEWGASSGHWLCEGGRKREAHGGKCNHFIQGKCNRIKLLPRDEFIKLGFREAIQKELEVFDFSVYPDKTKDGSSR